MKGGRALEFRFKTLVRSSRDVDIVLNAERGGVLDAILRVLQGEWSAFRFSVKGEIEERKRSFTFEVGADYNSADWSTFEVELVYGVVTDWDDVPAETLGALGLEAAAPIPCMTIAEQLAQKLHAVSDPEEDRARDLYDIYLLDRNCNTDDGILLETAVAEFERRGTHPWPPIIELREGWHPTLERLLAEDGLTVTVADVVAAVQSLILRLHGVTMNKRYKYLFVTLSALNHTPTLTETPVTNDAALENFTRLTQVEGWRLAHILKYPSREATATILAVLEKSVDEEQQ